jgi:hypothetical protein
MKRYPAESAILLNQKGKLKASSLTGKNKIALIVTQMFMQASSWKIKLIIVNVAIHLITGVLTSSIIIPQGSNLTGNTSTWNAMNVISIMMIIPKFSILFINLKI